MASLSSYLGKVHIYSSHLLELVVNKGHYEKQSITEFIEIRNTYLEEPFLIAYDNTEKHSYSLAALKAFQESSTVSIFAAFGPAQALQNGFAALISYSKTSAYAYFNNQKEALEWLNKFS